MVPSHSMNWLLLFHCSMVPSLKPSMGEQLLGVIPASIFLGMAIAKEPVALWIVLLWYYSKSCWRGILLVGTTPRGHSSHRLHSWLTALLTKPLTSRFLAIPWFDWYYSIIPLFQPWSCQWGNGLWGGSNQQLFWEQPVTKEPVALRIVL